MSLTLQPSEVAVMAMSANPSFPDEKHPLKPARGDERKLERITLRIQDRMIEHGIRYKELAALLPAKGGSIGTSVSLAARNVTHPDKLTRAQVDALTELLDCTVDYLRGDVGGDVERVVGRGSSNDIADLFDYLNESDKMAVWQHAEALLRMHDAESYAIWHTNFKNS